MSGTSESSDVERVERTAPYLVAVARVVARDEIRRALGGCVSSSRRWTILPTDDGPTFAIEGHGVQVFPELEHIEVVELAALAIGSVEYRATARASDGGTLTRSGPELDELVQLLTTTGYEVVRVEWRSVGVWSELDTTDDRSHG